MSNNLENYNLTTEGDKQEYYSRICADLCKEIRKIYVYPDYNGKDWKSITHHYKALAKKCQIPKDFYLLMKNR